MKKIYLLLITTVFSISLSHAQNIFPPAGKVGIGTTSPVGNLDIVDSLSGARLKFNFFNTSIPNCGGSPTNPGIQFHASDPSTGDTASGYFSYQNYNFILDPHVDGAGCSGLTGDGFVGIGEYNPNAKLDVAGTVMSGGSYANLDPAQIDLSFLSNSGKMLIGWNRSAGVGETDFIANSGAGTAGGFAFYNHPNTGAETQLMYITAGGNVLIGRDGQVNSVYKLDVNGFVRANEIVVNTTGADFVFEPTYHLYPLAGLKKYLDQNHHLPEIPSAKEMQTNGLNLGENQTKLLQKVEELTLYLIEKDNEIKKEQLINQTQQEQINLLKQAVSSNIEMQNELKVLKEQVALLLKQSNKK